MSRPSRLAIDDMHIVDFGDRRLREEDVLRRMMRSARTPHAPIPTRDDLVRDAALMRAVGHDLRASGVTDEAGHRGQP